MRPDDIHIGNLCYRFMKAYEKKEIHPAGSELNIIKQFYEGYVLKMNTIKGKRLFDIIVEICRNNGIE